MLAGFVQAMLPELMWLCYTSIISAILVKKIQ